LAKNNDEMLDPASGNYVHLEAGCVQTLTIVDTTAPTVTAPPAAQVSAPAYGPTAYIGTATAADAVGVVDIYNDAPYVYQQGPTTVTWYAVDEAGNVGSDSQVVVGKKRGGGAASPLWLVLLFSVIGVRNYYSRR
jgi:hypothetical protein